MLSGCNARLCTLDVFRCGGIQIESVYTGQGLGSDVMVQDGLSLLSLPGKLFEQVLRCQSWEVGFTDA